MQSRLLLKLGACCLLVFCAIWGLLPIKDRDFEAYIRYRANRDVSLFNEIANRAKGEAEKGKYPSFFAAIKAIGEKEEIDYPYFFKDLNVSDVPVLSKRNGIILNHLLKESKGKIKQGLDLRGGVGFTLSLVGSHDEVIGPVQVNKAIDIIAKRIDSLGVAEPIIRARGVDQVEIQLPGMSIKENPEAIQALKKPAKLEFRFFPENPLLRPGKNAKDRFLPGYEVLTMVNVDRKTGKAYESPFFVKKIPALTGSSVREAYLMPSASGAYEIGLRFTKDGAKRFAQLTRENVGRQLGIVLDGVLYSAPVINGEIPDGSASIQGDFSYREALDLVSVLNNPLEFELRVEELYDIGPSLAENARMSASYAALLGASLVIVFMVVYYFLGGVVAVVGVLVNVLLVLAVQSLIGATLTLPGIAGLVLTIGMGVDSNILVFERMKEELKEGKSLASALKAGYDRAFSTILDANLTTLLTAGILIWLGTGPVKGFGVTLAIGIMSSMFCVLVISRVLLECVIYKSFAKKLFAFNSIKAFNFDFLKLSKPAFIASWVIAIAGGVFVYFHHSKIYGIDFTGGDEVSLVYEKQIGVQDIYALAQNEMLGEVIPVYRTGKNQSVLKIQTQPNKGLMVYQALKKAYPEAQLELAGESTVGAAVSKSLKKDACIAVLVALLGIMLYVAFRFELGFGIGALVSTVHDIILSIGIFVMIGGQFSGPMVAAVLMIIGYSINDTIVVFDRIREELKVNPFTQLNKVINIAINKTLSRTLLTSVTTLLATLALYLFGMGQIHDFACVFLIGIVVGTFSSIFIASPVFYWWHKGDRRKVHPHRLNTQGVWDSQSTTLV